MSLDTHGAAELFGELVAERADVIRTGERAPISPLVRQLVYRRDRWRCQRCRAAPWAADPNRRSGALHLDHIVPWSAGGSDRSDNLAMSHPAVAKWCEQDDLARFVVYCGSHSGPGWALEGWHIL